MIIIIDFGSQTTHLISRRIKDLGVKTEIVLPQDALPAIKKFNPKGIILSGGPSSVYGEDALLVDKKIFDTPVPFLGICYGHEVMAHLLGGKVEPGVRKEYGPETLTIQKENSLLKGLNKEELVWNSHFDRVVAPPQDSQITGTTPSVSVASFADEKRKWYGTMFHPESHHTRSGNKILSNFLFDICGEIPSDQKIQADQLVQSVKSQIGNNTAVLALSGGIDSAVAAVLTHKAIGDKLTCLYVDTGMMRQGETQQIVDTFKKHFHLNLKVLKSEKEFLTALKGITDPEEKRKTIGRIFIEVFEKEAKKLGAKYLVQGTIYPDVIESKGTAHSHNIKSHHNVGGLPEKHGFKIVEPLRNLYKDEVREIAKDLGFPASLIWRHVFPGPGLAVRIIGEITKEKLDILRKADTIVVEELKKAGLYEKIWMGFAILTGIKTTGVAGDERKYGETIALRIIESKDTMSADWVRLPYDLLDKISHRIVTEVFEVVRVVYDITTKPPATMEWE
ncbi:glutamine-hydrolyzing GMP synthase [Candidatus Gottesmanbacteria bacterium RIFCSPHIGHO2_01_FULL_39_10]|uniref:GMP synthase [glutamine-hydrolyzing] n=1 Tax=Candidatus Gottesmanbacteria bacterium RIFCSPHIGHO2_01_FULL_39_10 TaxID=1798375 RepID=A0A1F5ZRL4_9BACT|nr:MAG: glutamine-hydrolyzing GMP synthase [Candidatus Gottesmanbacteria bacterium RIFCSPHIGHO2_01_FULL_39_10]